MNKSIKTLVAICVLLSLTACNAQIKNASQATVKIYGNCEMCEKTIEKAGNLKNEAQVDWNKDTKMATLIYDAKKTSVNVILKRIALSGYDNDSFLAPDDMYAKLPDCCQYKRVKKTAVSTTQPEMKIHGDSNKAMASHQQASPLKLVFDNYFSLKDALVKTDGNLAATHAGKLLAAIQNVKMEDLKTEEHAVWMKVMKNLATDAEHISITKDIAHQRDHFMSLSKNMHELIKTSKYEAPVYYQFCPMANDGKGANWLSLDHTIKNPYYGSQMLNCGKTVETIK
jgi:hypothetical protein